MPEIKRDDLCTPFMIATEQGFAFSDHVCGLEKSRNRKFIGGGKYEDLGPKTNLQLPGGGKYPRSHEIHAELDTIASIFAEHGYKVVTKEDIEAREKELEDTPKADQLSTSPEMK